MANNNSFDSAKSIMKINKKMVPKLELYEHRPPCQVRSDQSYTIRMKVLKSNLTDSNIGRNVINCLCQIKKKMIFSQSNY